MDIDREYIIWATNLSISSIVFHVNEDAEPIRLVPVKLKNNSLLLTREQAHNSSKISWSSLLLFTCFYKSPFAMSEIFTYIIIIKVNLIFIESLPLTIFV